MEIINGIISGPGAAFFSKTLLTPSCRLTIKGVASMGFAESVSVRLNNEMVTMSGPEWDELVKQVNEARAVP